MLKSMFFLSSKLLWALAAPLNLCAILLLTGAACLTFARGRTGRRIGKALGGSAAALLLLFGVFPFGQTFLAFLETRYPPLETPVPHVEGIILLGGAVETALPRPHGMPQLNDHADRLVEFARLARLYPQARLAFTGGSADIAQTGRKEADLLPPLFELLGIAPERIVYENKSRNTYENALFSKEILKPGPGAVWILVTSAFHMPRSMAVFRAAGWAVVPAPADFKTDGQPRWIPDRLDVAGNLADFSVALREVIGIAAYRLSGKIALENPAPIR